MDFGKILHIAKKNSESNNNDSKYYQTKFAPPKKETKDKKLSDNIQRFLKRREEEERKERKEKMEKAAQLMAMRDEKSKNKIKKMLKVTKSANKSVLDDAKAEAARPEYESADVDDYGYTSSTANAFFQKYIEKVKDVKDDKGFAPSRPQTIKDLKGTTERVKAAILREKEEKELGSKHSKSQSSSISTSTSTTSIGSLKSNREGDNFAAQMRKSSKPLYDPEAERLEEERKRKEMQQEKSKNRRPPPPPMDFQALLKLAEKKQFEPVAITTEVKKTKEPERLLTSKERKELEERQKAKEERERRQREMLNTKDKKNSKDNLPNNSGGRIPKLVESTKPNNKVSTLSQEKTNKPESLKAKSRALDIRTESAMKTLPKNPSKPNVSSLNGKLNATTATLPKGVQKSSAATSSSTASYSASATSSLSKTSTVPKNSSIPGKSNLSTMKSEPNTTRQFPPSDIRAYVPKKLPSAKTANSNLQQKTRQFPPPDVMRSNKARKPQKQGYKRRIDDDDDDYDSEMDDFIEDGDEEEDYSAHIRSIFGYDRNKYRNMDDDDDLTMESNFAQVQREEFISKKIGIQEDLEDMRLEALAKKKKLESKKPKRK